MRSAQSFRRSGTRGRLSSPLSVIKSLHTIISMVVGLLALAAVPTTIGVSTAIGQGDKDPDKDARRSTECNLVVNCTLDSTEARSLHGKEIVLRDNKVSSAVHRSFVLSQRTISHLILHLFLQVFVGFEPSPDFYPFSGFYINYPNDEQHLGLVSMISKSPPAMGWIYVDRHTLEARYGNRTASIDHIVGPWDWTLDESRVMLEDKEAFVAVEDGENWPVYFNRNGNRAELPAGKRILPVKIERRVREQPKEAK